MGAERPHGDGDCSPAQPAARPLFQRACRGASTSLIGPKLPAGPAPRRVHAPDGVPLIDGSIVSHIPWIDRSGCSENARVVSEVVAYPGVRIDTLFRMTGRKRRATRCRSVTSWMI